MLRAAVSYACEQKADERTAFETLANLPLTFHIKDTVSHFPPLDAGLRKVSLVNIVERFQPSRAGEDAGSDLTLDRGDECVGGIERPGEAGHVDLGGIRDHIEGRAEHEVAELPADRLRIVGLNEIARDPAPDRFEPRHVRGERERDGLAQSQPEMHRHFFPNAPPAERRVDVIERLPPRRVRRRGETP